MTEATTSVTPVGAGMGAATTTVGDSTSPATSPTGAGATPQTPPDFDFTKIDWAQHADKIPWERIDLKQIEKIPGVSKMQGAFARKLREAEQRSQADLRAMQAQLQQYQTIVAGQYPDMQPHLQTIQTQSDLARMQMQLEEYQRREAIRALSEQYGVEESVFMDNPPQDPTDALMRVADYHRNRYVQTEQTMTQQLAALQRQLDALTKQRQDPAANQDVQAAAPSGSAFQTEWEALMKDGRYAEANRLIRSAEEKGVAIDTSRMKPPGWR